MNTKDFFAKQYQKRKEWYRDYALKNKEKRHQYYLHNKEKMIINATKWRNENTERNIEIQRKYRCENYLEVYKKYDNKCLECGTLENLSIHHIDHSGKSNNPNNKIENLQLLCFQCHGKIHGAESKEAKRKV